jgi:hypothetical protein
VRRQVLPALCVALVGPVPSIEQNLDLIRVYLAPTKSASPVDGVDHRTAIDHGRPLVTDGRS